MDNSAAQLALVLFACALPGSMYFWALGFLCAGYLRDPVDQDSIFRIGPLNSFFRFAALTASPLRTGPNPYGLVGAGVGIACCNFIPAALLVRNPYGDSSLVVDLLYLLVHGIWLATVARAIRRSRSR